jgi:large repetitive protein
LAGGVFVVSGSEVTVPNVTVTAGGRYALRFQVSGASPTVLSAKAWQVGSAEPVAWQLTSSDSDPALQGPGAVGVNLYLPGIATQPLNATVDDVEVRTVVSGE